MLSKGLKLLLAPSRPPLNQCLVIFSMAHPSDRHGLAFSLRIAGHPHQHVEAVRRFPFAGHPRHPAEAAFPQFYAGHPHKLAGAANRCQLAGHPCNARGRLGSPIMPDIHANAWGRHASTSSSSMGTYTFTLLVFGITSQGCLSPYSVICWQ